MYYIIYKIFRALTGPCESARSNINAVPPLLGAAALRSPGKKQAPNAQQMRIGGITV